jgi:glycosyltransferase involved in cell wall biosynthesis
MNNPRIVIGLPVYNGENFVRRALDSILSQTFTDWRVIIGDNCSTDATGEICQEYAKQDNRISYHRHSENIGAAKNFNFVFQPGNAPYFKWAAHDDTFQPEYLAKCIELLDRDPTLAIAHCPALEIDGDDKVINTYDRDIRLNSNRPRDRFWRILWVRHFTEVFGVMRSDLVAKTKLYGSYIGSDRNLVAEMILLGDVGYVEEYLFSRRHHKTSYMASVFDSQERLKWFDPTSKKPVFKGLVITQEYLSSIMTLPLPATERLACLKVLLGWGIARAIEVVSGDRDRFRQKIAIQYAAHGNLAKD